ncbi:hypothetical protein FACS189481_4410 [Clostridia bacterium]|nr:hypothetical protein FACS189481_4410 [Clostridia bacterium]
MKNVTKKAMCQLLALLIVCQMRVSEAANVKMSLPEQTEMKTATVVREKPKPENTYVYKLLKKNKKIKKSELKSVVKRKKFVGLVMFLFEYEDAMNAMDQAEEKGLIKGLESLEESSKNVTLGDAIKLGLRVTNISFDDTDAEEYFETRKDKGIIPASKELDSKFNYGVALNILEDIRLERAGYFKASKTTPINPERMVVTSRPRKGIERSPDGKYEAFLLGWSGVYNVFVRDLTTRQERRVSSATDCDVKKIYWGDGYLFFAKDNGYDEHDHVWVASFNGQKERDLTPTKGKHFGWRGTKIFDEVPYVLVANYDKAKGEYALNAINLENDKWEPLKWRGEDRVCELYDIPDDNNNQLKVASEFNYGENAKIYEINKKTGDETLIFEVARNRQFIPQFVSEDGSILYGLSNNKTKTLCPVALNLGSGELKVLYKDDDYDVLNDTSYTKEQPRPLCDFGTSQPLMVQYYAKKFKAVGINSKVKEALEEAKEEIGSEEVRVLNISPNLNEYTLQRVLPTGAGNKYIYKLNTKKLKCIESNEVANITQKLDVNTRPISYWSRDKLKIEGYLTLPLGKSPENLPTVILVHGGPWVRDFWAYSFEAQFLQSLGYAVLQINFRGSAGYGREFLEKGNRQWGEKIQNDITDGTRWLIKKGIADKDRIAIYGTSFGGYAALCGLTFTPKLYACGVSQCGFSDVIKHLQNAPDYFAGMINQYYHHVGDPVADAEKLKKASPFYHLDKIERPLFVAQGANDSRVKRAESDRVVNALNEDNPDLVEYMIREGEGHGFRKPQNLRDFYEWLEKFLAKHLKPEKKAKATKKS